MHLATKSVVGAVATVSLAVTGGGIALAAHAPAGNVAGHPAVARSSGRAGAVATRPAAPEKKAPKGKIVFTYGPGTGKPGAKLGPFKMHRFPADKRRVDELVTTIKGPTGTVGLKLAAEHVKVPTSWRTWSNGYKGSVYWAGALGDPTTEVLTLPKGTKAIYFYVEPDEFKTHDIVVTAQNGVTSGHKTILGKAGAEYYGFHASGALTIQTITIASNDDFAVGEFAIAK